MKLILLALSFCFNIISGIAQTKSINDTWKITLNKKELINTGKEDESANVKTVAKKDLVSSMVVSYTESKPRKDWTRSILIYDEKDNELYKKKIVGSVKLSSSDLKKLMGASKTWKVYTMSLPTDPKIAATVRVRRVHLCTLMVKS